MIHLVGLCVCDGYNVQNRILIPSIIKALCSAYLAKQLYMCHQTAKELIAEIES